MLNIKINRQKLVNVCGYKLETNWQNRFLKYTSRLLSLSEYIEKNVLGGIFGSHCIYSVNHCIWSKIGVVTFVAVKY